MNKSEAAKIRAQEQKRFDPMFFKRLGSVGGSTTGVKKGFSALHPDKVREIRAKGLETRRKNNEAKQA